MQNPELYLRTGEGTEAGLPMSVGSMIKLGKKGLGPVHTEYTLFALEQVQVGDPAFNIVDDLTTRINGWLEDLHVSAVLSGSIKRDAEVTPTLVVYYVTIRCVMAETVADEPLPPPPPPPSEPIQVWPTDRLRFWRRAFVAACVVAIVGALIAHRQLRHQRTGKHDYLHVTPAKAIQERFP